MIKLLIADDHSIVREGVKNVLQGIEGIEIVGEAVNGKEVLELAKSNTFNTVLLDLHMPEMDGIQCAQKLRSKYSGIRVLVFSMMDNMTYIQLLINTGVKGFLSKDASPTEIEQALRIVHRGEKYYSTKFRDAIVESYINNIDCHLTSREKEVLELIFSDMTNEGIAYYLNISKRTVESHKRNIFEKTGVKTVAGLLQFAIANKLL